MPDWFSEGFWIILFSVFVLAVCGVVAIAIMLVQDWVERWIEGRRKASEADKATKMTETFRALERKRASKAAGAREAADVLPPDEPARDGVAEAREKFTEAALADCEAIESSKPTGRLNAAKWDAYDAFRAAEREGGA